MSKLEIAIAQIEAVTGREFSNPPGELSPKEHKQFAKKEYCETIIPGFKNIFWALHRLFRGYEHTSRYLIEEHAVTIKPEDEQALGNIVRRHECGHAFQIEHWPELEEKVDAPEGNYLRQSVKEGIADYLSLPRKNEATLAQIKALRGKPLAQRRANAVIQESAIDWEGFDYRSYAHNKYALGIALAEVAVTEAGDVWTGLDRLARNPPRTIDEAYRMLEANRTSEAEE